jgi:acetolactate synthase regulatory subunit
MMMSPSYQANGSSFQASGPESATQQQRLACRMQNRLGALDRLLGAFTHRGIIPQGFQAQPDASGSEMLCSIRFECDNEHQVRQLVKAIEKQVYVLSVECSLGATASVSVESSSSSNTNKAVTQGGALALTPMTATVWMPAPVPQASSTTSTISPLLKPVTSSSERKAAHGR